MSSSNGKRGILFLSAAVFFAAAVVCLLYLRIYPPDESLPEYFEETTRATERETEPEPTDAYGKPVTSETEILIESSMSAEAETGIEEISQESTTAEIRAEQSTAIVPTENAGLRSEAEKFEEYRLQLIRNTRKTVLYFRIGFVLSLVLSLSLLILLSVRFGRERDREGIELSLFMIAAGLFILIRLYESYGYEWIITIDADGHVSPAPSVSVIDIVQSFAAALLFVWGVYSMLCFFIRKLPAGWSLLYRITEKCADQENGLSFMLLIPAFFFMVTLGAALFLFFTKWDTGFDLFIVLLFIEAAVFFFILLNRVKAVKLKQQATIEKARISERMRVDLVANVSHDLRTPLTSIIGYGELLEREKLSEEGQRNLSKLEEKSAYLREMVDAVFELAKVSSGTVKCRCEEIDLIRLLEQTIGDYEDQLREKGFEVRRHYETAQLPILSDGIFLHQVFSNLLSNAIKYTMPGTRIHLEVKRNDAEITVRMMNVASYEMTFTEEEIMERFARGDASRNTEGSGLGLAIAKTYTEAVGGRFHIEVDGDQFAAVVRLPDSLREM